MSAELLSSAGFDPHNAKKLLSTISIESEPVYLMRGMRISGNDLQTEKDPRYVAEGIPVDILQHARKLAGAFSNDAVESEHLLLALLQRHRSGAYALLTKLGVNQQRLENRLVEHLQNRSGLT